MERPLNIQLTQLKAMVIRNWRLKKAEKRKTAAEILMPLYFFGILTLISVMTPHFDYPVLDQPRGSAKLFQKFELISNFNISVVPDNDDTKLFTDEVNKLWNNLTDGYSNFDWNFFPTEDDLLDAYWLNASTVIMAIIFEGPGPINGPLKYKIRTNPDVLTTPATTSLYGSVTDCREVDNSNFFPIEIWPTCPINGYFYSHFIAVQTLVDYTKISMDAGGDSAPVPNLILKLLPKASYKGNWLDNTRPLLVVFLIMALSQFLPYLLVLIVIEKEKKIKEGMKIMGLNDSVYWLSWFIIYAIITLVITLICCIFLFLVLDVFRNSNQFLIFAMLYLFCLSLVMIAFMVTPFFDKATTAGIVAGFAVPIISLLYFIKLAIGDSSVFVLWLLSLLSPTGFAIAFDQALINDNFNNEGVHFDNLWSGSGMPIGGSLLILCFDLILYGLLAYYLDSVIPSEHGTKRSPFFCFSSSYWFPKKPNFQFGPTGTPDHNLDIEPIPSDLIGKEAIVINNLHKSFKKWRKPSINAVNGVGLTIFQDQITALLGHNGAGKTTIINMLTGLIAPSSGSGFIFGLDISNPDDMEQIRKMTGVCPQHDILFDNLTPKEHLEVFAAIKGIPPSKRNEIILKTIKDVDLADKVDTNAKKLSGGQKRKLSIAIAIIGDPKIIILDEPTAGVDPYSRRHMWSVLQNCKQGRVILLTTHFMDEADILADRKAVISKGKLRCCGSSLFLKNKFGIGYHLTMVLEGTADSAITNLVTSHIPTAEKVRHHGKEINFILPYSQVNNFAPLFSAIEEEINNKTRQLGISSYGVSMTTLEEVFLHLEKEEMEETTDQFSKAILKNKSRSRITTALNGAGDNISLESKTELLENGVYLESIPTNPNKLQTLMALLRLRFVRLIRDKQKLVFLFLLPIGLLTLGVYLNGISSAQTDSQILPLTSSTYGDNTRYIVHNGTGGSLEPFMRELAKFSPQVVSLYDGKFSSLLETAPQMSALNIANTNLTLLYNDTLQHSLPIIINSVNNIMYRLLLPDAAPIEIATHPFQRASEKEPFNPVMISSTYLIGFIFVIIPVSLAVDMVYDREIKAKNQLRVNGLSFFMYFLSYFLVLIGLMLLISALLIVILLLFQLPSMSQPPALIMLVILILLYTPASILFTTLWSYMFDKMESSQQVLPTIAIISGLVPFMAIFLLEQLEKDQTVSYALHLVFSLLDPFYVPYTIFYNIDRVYVLCSINQECEAPVMGDYMSKAIVTLIIALIVQIPLWVGLLVIFDVKKSGGTIRSFLQSVFKKKTEKYSNVNEMNTMSENEDDDVKAEREKIVDHLNSPSRDPPVVLVHNLHKRYDFGFQFNKNCLKKMTKTSKIAVKNLSLAINAGEVFGLLGHNGAGKTTTMRIIIAEEAPTKGTVQINGKDIESNLNEAFQLLGYCPQDNVLWKDVTVKEHLVCYAGIRGVAPKDIPRMIDSYLTGLQIHEHADKQAQECSGGTKRKLSFALSMVGNPKIVLLDEPSTGMDPQSKRFLWDTILASFQGSRGAILTTHSMEEADALCTRVGIMVNGELRCLGSTQHLKNLYGAGYTLEVKLRKTEDLSNVTEFENFVKRIFSDCSLQEHFADRLVFSVPQKSVPSLANCFRQLEIAKIDYNVEEYSFSQTTLEQVFIRFAQQTDVDD